MHLTSKWPSSKLEQFPKILVECLDGFREREIANVWLRGVSRVGDRLFDICANDTAGCPSRSSFSLETLAVIDANCGRLRR